MAILEGFPIVMISGVSDFQRGYLDDYWELEQKLSI